MAGKISFYVTPFYGTMLDREVIGVDDPYHRRKTTPGRRSVAGRRWDLLRQNACRLARTSACIINVVALSRVFTQHQSKVSLRRRRDRAKRTRPRARFSKYVRPITVLCIYRRCLFSSSRVAIRENSLRPIEYFVVRLYRLAADTRTHAIMPLLIVRTKGSL